MKNSTTGIKWQHIAIITALCFLAYSNTLNNAFVYDDHAAIVDNGLIKDLANIPGFFSKPVFSTSQVLHEGYRPLVMVSLALNYALGGLAVEGYHIVNILMHAANALLVYVFLLLITGQYNNGRLAALAASLIPIVARAK